jgi:ribonuclease P protein component
MISKQHRFHGLGSLNFAYRKGQTVRGQLLSVRYIRNNRLSSYRVAVVVSKKVHKSAVVRNRIRRRIYEIVRSIEPNITQPYDIVITAQSDQAAEINHAELVNALTTALKNAHVVN